MKTPQLYPFAVVLAACAALLTSCGKKSDAVTEAAKEEKTEGIPAPSIEPEIRS